MADIMYSSGTKGFTSKQCVSITECNSYKDIYYELTFVYHYHYFIFDGLPFIWN